MAHNADSAGIVEHAELSGGVVVGDDGSVAAAQAMRAAAREAALRSLPLHVIRAWSIMNAPRPANAPPGYVPSMAEFQDTVVAELNRRVTEVLGESGAGAVVHAVHGPAASGLIEASRSADLLVIGARGLGGFTNMLLGSVAEKVIRHAECSVLVIRG